MESLPPLEDLPKLTPERKRQIMRTFLIHSRLNKMEVESILDDVYKKSIKNTNEQLSRPSSSTTRPVVYPTGLSGPASPTLTSMSTTAATPKTTPKPKGRPPKKSPIQIL